MGYPSLLESQHPLYGKHLVVRYISYLSFLTNSSDSCVRILFVTLTNRPTHYTAKEFESLYGDK